MSFAGYAASTYKVSEATLRKEHDCEVPFTAPDIFTLCDTLAAAKGVSDDLLYYVLASLADYPEDECEIYIKLLSKTLRLGVTAKSINKAIPGLIPEWEVQQAYPIEKYPLKDGVWFSVSEKLNGVRATFYRGNMIGRSGAIIDGLDHIVDGLSAYPDWVFDGELTLKDKDNRRLQVNDFDYDVMQKKRLARMAQHRKCGSKSKKCSLPSDHITQKQWKERNGKVYTFKLNEPMSWAQFKELTPDLQKEYLENLIQRYNANAKTIGQMFAVSSRTILNFVKDNGLGSMFRRGISMNEEQKAAWGSFLCGADAADDRVEEEADLCVDKPSSAEMPEPDSVETGRCPRASQLKQFSLVFEGSLDIDMIANSIRGIIENGREGRIQIFCDL